jgi:hypothetical protein
MTQIAANTNASSGKALGKMQKAIKKAMVSAPSAIPADVVDRL